MLIKKCLFATLLLLLSAGAFAGVIKGRIIDDHGVALPYATIFLEGTTTGVNANGDGYYELTVQPGLYKVHCQYIGYRQSVFNITVNGEEAVQHNFTLQGQGLEMKEVVVHSSQEDPAYDIIRHAVKRRRFHLGQVHSFQTDIYLKTLMRSRVLPKKFMGEKVLTDDMMMDSAGRGILYLSEEDASYYTQDNNERTVIHSVHESGNPGGVGFSRFPAVITFYDNDVNVFGNSSRGFISPVSDNALFYYKYKLQGQFQEEGHTVYKIDVRQKRAYEPCFNGTIYIVDSEYAIHSLNMTLTKQSGMDMIDTLRIEQLFLPLQKDTWVIKSQVLFIAVKLLGFDVTAQAVTVYNGQQVNMPIPDTMFDKNIISSYDKAANKKDTSYWTGARPIPLQLDEKKDYVVKDSVTRAEDSPAFKDSLRRKGNHIALAGLIATGTTFSSKEYRNTYTFNPVFIGLAENDNILNYNIVEGLNLAPKLTWRHRIDSSNYLNGAVAVRYGFSNTHFNSIAKLYYEHDDKHWIGRSFLIGAEGGKYVFQYNPDNPVTEWFNTYAALLYRSNDLKIYERWDANVYAHRFYGNGLSWFIKTSFQRRLPLENTTDYSFFKGNSDGFKSNTPPRPLQEATAWEVHNAALVHASVSYKPGYTYTQYPDYKVANGSDWPRLTLIYDKGIPGPFDSKVNFDKIRFTVRDDIRLRLLGSLSYNFAIGGFLNTDYVSIPDLMHLYGDRGIGYASPYLTSFQFAQYYDWSNKEPLYGEGHVEYHLNGLLSNKVPLLRQARFYLLFGGNAFYARQSDYYTEAFVGIENIGYKLFRFLRVDFVQSWDSHMGHNSGIRFAITSKNFSVTKANPTGSEW